MESSAYVEEVEDSNPNQPTPAWADNYFVYISVNIHTPMYNGN